MTHVEIAVQIITMILTMVTMTRKTVKSINWWMYITNTANALIKIVLKLTDSIASSVLVVIRSLLAANKDKLKFKYIMHTIIILHLIFGIACYKNIWSVLSIIAPVIVTYACWRGSQQEIRIASMISDICWATYFCVNGVWVYGVFKYVIDLQTLIITISKRKTIRERAI